MTSETTSSTAYPGGCRSASRPLRAIVGSAVVSAALYLAFAVWSGWGDVSHAFQRIGLAGVALALGLSLVNYGLRFIRWQRYLAVLGHAIPWRASLRIYLAGFALTATPGKAGELLRGVLLQRWNVPYERSFAAFLSERISDLLAVFLLALLGIGSSVSMRPIVAAAAAGLAAAALVLRSRRLLDRMHRSLEGGSRLRRLAARAVTVLSNARRCFSPALLAQGTLLSILAWMAEALAFHFLLQLIGLDTSVAFSIFVYATSMLAGALSFLPGGVGGAEAVMVTLLVWKGAPMSEAVAATLVIRLATLWFAVALGAGILMPALRRPAPR